MSNQKKSLNYHLPFLPRVSPRFRGRRRQRVQPLRARPNEAQPTAEELACGILEKHSRELLKQARAVIDAAVVGELPSTDAFSIASQDAHSNLHCPTYRDFVRQRKQGFINRVIANGHLAELRETLSYHAQMTQLRDYYGDETFFAALDALRTHMLSTSASTTATLNNEIQGSLPESVNPATKVPSLEQEEYDASY
jgi:hypothetical protein